MQPCRPPGRRSIRCRRADLHLPLHVPVRSAIIRDGTEGAAADEELRGSAERREQFIPGEGEEPLMFGPDIVDQDPVEPEPCASFTFSTTRSRARPQTTFSATFTGVTIC